jgi:DNA gyrase subunit A
MEVKDGDQLIQAKISNGEDTIIMATKGGKSIRFEETQVRPTGRRTKGVRGIRLSSTDEVIGMLIAKREGTVLVTSENGYGKRSLLDAYRIQGRGGKGVYTMKKTPKTGQLITILETTDEDDLMIITNAGVMIRQKVDLIRVIGRNTQGVKLIRLDDGSKISSVTKVMNDPDDDDDNNEQEEGSEEIIE